MGGCAHAYAPRGRQTQGGPRPRGPVARQAAGVAGAAAAGLWVASQLKGRWAGTPRSESPKNHRAWVREGRMHHRGAQPAYHAAPYIYTGAVPAARAIPGPPIPWAAPRQAMPRGRGCGVAAEMSRPRAGRRQNSKGAGCWHSGINKAAMSRRVDFCVFRWKKAQKGVWLLVISLSYPRQTLPNIDVHKVCSGLRELAMPAQNPRSHGAISPPILMASDRSFSSMALVDRGRNN